MIFADHDHVVDELSADTADKPFGHWFARGDRADSGLLRCVGGKRPSEFKRAGVRAVESADNRPSDHLSDGLRRRGAANVDRVQAARAYTDGTWVIHQRMHDESLQRWRGIVAPAPSVAATPQREFAPVASSGRSMPPVAA